MVPGVAIQDRDVFAPEEGKADGLRLPVLTFAQR